jgi:hypothetical protein
MFLIVSTEWRNQKLRGEPANEFDAKTAEEVVSSS